MSCPPMSRLIGLGGTSRFSSAQCSQDVKK